MDEGLTQNLEDLGLSEKEAKVYMAALSLGPAPVQKIADLSGIKRVTTYVILESLINLGLVSQTTRGRKTFFVAEEPVSLRRLIAKKEQELKDQKENLEHLLPKLSKLKTLPKDLPSVQFYDTAEGIRAMMMTYYAGSRKGSVKEVYGISNLDQLYSFYPEFKEASSNPARVASGIHSKFIYTYSGGPIYKESDKLKNRESRFVPLDKYPINGDINILGDYVVLLALSGPKPLAVSIKSKEISKGAVALFDMAWEAASKFN